MSIDLEPFDPSTLMLLISFISFDQSKGNDYFCFLGNINLIHSKRGKVNYISLIYKKKLTFWAIVSRSAIDISSKSHTPTHTFMLLAISPTNKTKLTSFFSGYIVSCLNLL